MERGHEGGGGRTEEWVEREVVVEADAERAWEAISDPPMLERWLAEEVELEPVEGAPARFRVDGEERPGRVERVVEGRALDFSWERVPGRRSLVELELTPCVSGTRIRVIETRLSAGAGPIGASAADWATRLHALRSLFVLVAA